MAVLSATVRPGGPPTRRGIQRPRWAGYLGSGVVATVPLELSLGDWQGRSPRDSQAAAAGQILLDSGPVGAARDMITTLIPNQAEQSGRCTSTLRGQPYRPSAEMGPVH